MNDGRFETILKTILNGDLSKKEIERRLQEVIDKELSGPLDAPADMELVEKCQSLLWELATNGSIPYPDHAEESKQKLVQKLEQPSFGRRTSFLRRLFVVAAAFVLVCGLSLISIRWITGTSSPDGEQYIIQGHEITSELIQNCIAEQTEANNLQFTTSSRTEAEGYLGFRLPLPVTMCETFEIDKIFINVLPIWIQCKCNYSNENEEISISMYFVSDVNDAVLFTEQDKNGMHMLEGGIEIYVSSNTGNNALTWTMGNVVFRVTGNFTLEDGIEIVRQIKGGVI